MTSCVRNVHYSTVEDEGGGELLMWLVGIFSSIPSFSHIQKGLDQKYVYWINSETHLFSQKGLVIIYKKRTKCLSSPLLCFMYFHCLFTGGQIDKN